MKGLSERKEFWGDVGEFAEKKESDLLQKGLLYLEWQVADHKRSGGDGGGEATGSSSPQRTLLDRLREENALDIELYRWVLNGMPDDSEMFGGKRRRPIVAEKNICNEVALNQRHANTNGPGRPAENRLLERRLEIRPILDELSELRTWKRRTGREAAETFRHQIFKARKIAPRAAEKKENKLRDPYYERNHLNEFPWAASEEVLPNSTSLVCRVADEGRGLGCEV
jgi:hypothetical protein